MSFATSSPLTSDESDSWLYVFNQRSSPPLFLVSAITRFLHREAVKTGGCAAAGEIKKRSRSLFAPVGI